MLAAMLDLARRFPLALAAFTLVACGGGGGGGGGNGSSSGTGSGGTGGSVPEDVPCPSAPADLSLEGTWAVKGKLAVSLKGAPGGAITICPADQVGESSMLLLLTIKQDPADATKLSQVSATLCSIELPTVSALVGSCDPKSPSLVFAQMIAPKALLDALPKIATMPAGGSISGKQAGAALTLEKLTVVVGSTKGGSMLPKWDDVSDPCAKPDLGHTTVCEPTCVADCASLRDDDGDAFPGVTAQICGRTADDQKKNVPCNADKPNQAGTTLQGKAFIDIQVDPQFVGTAKSSCELTGTVDPSTQILYQVLGTDVWLAGASLGVDQAIKSLPSFTVDSTKSKFRMVRVDGKYGAPDWKIDATNPSAACATIDMRVNEL
jgi:hypothetical protein